MPHCLDHFMTDRLRSILLIVNLKTLLVTAMAISSTFLCLRYQVVADFPLTLIATAVVFPIVFSIGGAYKRREAALDAYGSMKAHGRAVFFAVRDWLDAPDNEAVEEAKHLLGAFLCASRTLFTQPREAMTENEEAVYREFSNLSRFIRTQLRARGLTSTEVSRCNQYLSKMIIAFEKVKHIYQYRTPQTLRAFSDVFIIVLPVLYGPHFAEIAGDDSGLLAYVMPVLFSVVLVCLDIIQEHLEDPFDQIGEDDIAINAEKFVTSLDL